MDSIFNLNITRKPGREGHPWIFRSEIRNPPRATGWVRLPQGDLAYYRTGATLAARVLPGLRDPDELNDWALEKIRIATEKRPPATSIRVFHGEADGISGLVIDRYLTAGGANVLVIQLQNATAELLRPHLSDILDPQVHAVILRLDSRSRSKDGLPSGGVEILKNNLAESELRRARVCVGRGASKLELTCDLIKGQKTGLFLDQVENALGLAEFVSRSGVAQPLKVLDLFSYVGLWSKAFASRLQIQPTGWDRSETALRFYKENLGPTAETIRSDFFQATQTRPLTQYDIVICDPPALIPTRDDLDRGKGQYKRAFSYALQLTKPGGLCVLSSCSQLLSEEDFEDLIPKRALVWRGNQSSDHPAPEHFPEALYLKCAAIRA